MFVLKSEIARNFDDVVSIFFSVQNTNPALAGVHKHLCSTMLMDIGVLSIVLKSARTCDYFSFPKKYTFPK